ncbi:hypothetical protein K8S19_09685 [bacterium]|nr:hypothetical protein [bacterium]
MKNYEEEFKKFQLTKGNFPKYKDPESYAMRFKKCSIYKYVNISYTNTTQNEKDCKNA